MSALPVWRICSARYADSAYSGEGARLFGGRWSPAGIRIAYTAESRALAVVEVLANADPEHLASMSWMLIAAEIPEELIEKPARVPDGWRQFPHPLATQEFGARWAREQRSAVLRVPSAVVPGEFNYLLNPEHPDFKHVKIAKPETFTFDPRLVG